MSQPQPTIPSEESPTIAFQPPLFSLLTAYERGLPAQDQPDPAIPQVLRDALAARETVFVEEQRAVALAHHTDADDARACHWTLYAGRRNLHRYASQEDGAVDTEATLPPGRVIGAIRLVPYPHHPKPQPTDIFLPPSPSAPTEPASRVFTAPPPPYRRDRATTLHDGVEPFVKLGRLCVVPAARGHRLADILIRAALEWAAAHADVIAQTARSLAGEEGEMIPEWRGLVCVYAQIRALGTWRRNGFVLDEQVGVWTEAGIPHYAMFRRVQLKTTSPSPTSTIRLAQEPDIPLLREIEVSAAQLFHTIGLTQPANSTPLPAAQLTKMRAAGTLWVAINLETAVPCGFLGGYPLAETFYIAELSVAREAQGRGVGRALLRHVCGEMRARGRGQVALVTFRDVPWNGPWYGRMGFREVEAGAMGEEYVSILEKEARHGFDVNRRCVMKLDLKS